ncbi:MAG: hypothetical protein RR359_02165 [Bacilli bacterium]
METISNHSFVIDKLNNSAFITYLYTIHCDVNIISEEVYLNTSKENKTVKIVSLIKNNNFLIYKNLIFKLINKGYVKERAKEEINKLYNTFNLSIDKDKLDDIELVKLSLINALIDTDIIIIKNIFIDFNYKERNKIINILKQYCFINNIKIILLTTNTNDLLYSDYTYVISHYKNQLEGNSINVLKQDLLLNKLNFELPLVIDLSVKLNFYGLLNDTFKDVESLVNKLWN